MAMGIFKSLSRDRYVDKIDIMLSKKALQQSKDRTAMVFGERSVHPSSASSCLRAIFYMWLGVPTTNLPDARTLRIFGNGDGMHERFQSYYRDMGIMWGNWKCLKCNTKYEGYAQDAPCKHKVKHQYYAEYTLDYPEFRVIGRTDGILIDPKYNKTGKLADFKDKATILELKSMNSNGFSKLTKPKPEHIIQAHLYMLSLGINSVCFQYENKDNQEVKEYIVLRDEVIMTDLTDRITELFEYWDKQELPPRECKNPKWCNHGDECYIYRHKLPELLKAYKKLLEANNAKKKPEQSRKKLVPRKKQPRK